MRLSTDTGAAIADTIPSSRVSSSGADSRRTSVA